MLLISTAPAIKNKKTGSTSACSKTENPPVALPQRRNIIRFLLMARFAVSPEKPTLFGRTIGKVCSSLLQRKGKINGDSRLELFRRG